MKIGAFLIAVTLLHVEGQSVDLTLQAREVGSEVVDAVIDRLSLACVFDNDKQMLRRMAKAETDDGEDLKRSGSYVGGIWKISAADHQLIRTQGSAYFADVLAETAIDITKARFTDYEKPLYSGIAASIKLAIKTAVSGIPWSCEEQAVTWTEIYHTTGIRNESYYLAVCDAEAAMCEVPKADIVIVVDESGSIGASNFDLVRTFVNDVIGTFDATKNGVRIGVIKYATEVSTVAELNAAHGTASLQTKVQNMAYGGGGTRTDRALLKMRDMLNSGRSRLGIPQIGIVITDGQSNDEAALIQAVEEIKGEAFTVFSVGVTSGAVLAELQTYGSDPDCLHVYTIDDFEDMSGFVSQIQQLTCKAPAELPDDGDVAGELGNGEVLFFRLKVQKTGNGVTIKLKMNSGSSKLHLSWRVRNPSEAVYDYLEEVLPNNKEGVWMYIPWPTDLPETVDETYLYGALEGGSSNVANNYVLEYVDGMFGGTVQIKASLLAVALATVTAFFW